MDIFAQTTTYYVTTDGASSAAVAGAIGGALAAITIPIIIISMAISIFMIVSMWKIFTKAGREGWASLIPIYNLVVMIQIAELPTWYVILYLVPIAQIYAMFKVYIELAKKFGKSAGFGVGMVLLSIIFIPILAFSKKAVYTGNNITNNNGNFDSSQNMMPNNQYTQQPMPMQTNNIQDLNNIPQNQYTQQPVQQPQPTNNFQAPINDSQQLQTPQQPLGGDAQTGDNQQNPNAPLN